MTATWSKHEIRAVDCVRAVGLCVPLMIGACVSDDPPPGSGGSVLTSSGGDGSDETGDDDGNDIPMPAAYPDLDCEDPPTITFEPIDNLLMTAPMGGGEDIDGNCVDGGSDPEQTECLIESHALGIAVGDYDGDGWSDLFLSDSYGPARLFRNLEGAGFEEVGANKGVLVATPSSGAAWVDGDKDGDLDLYVLTWLGTRQRYFRNEGDHFDEVAMEIGVDMKASHSLGTTSVAVGDYDLDGWPDLFVTGWRPYAQGSESSVNRLFHNLGPDQPGHFEEVSVAAGLEFAGLTTLPFSNVQLFGGFAAAFADLDGDDHPELIEVADFGGEQVFRNLGDGSFDDATESWGAGQTRSGMGLSVGDLDGDADLDWFATSIAPISGSCENLPDQAAGNRLYLNELDGPSGGVDVADDEARVACSSWGWGTAMADLDNDGDLDLTATNGWYEASLPGGYYEQDPDRVWINPGDPRQGMTLCSAELNFDDDGQGRALVTFDFDGDGDLDFLESRAASTPLMYRNDGGNEAGASLRVALRGHESMTTGRGARIAVRVDEQSSWQLREIGQASHFLGHSELLAHFGLGSHEGPVQELRVCWPVSGRMQKLEGVAAGLLTLDENDADIELGGQPCASAITDPNY